MVIPGLQEKYDQNEFIDAEADLAKVFGLTFKDVVFRHLAKLSLIATREFKEGYWEEKPVAMSGGVYVGKIYHEDTRDAYINAVDFLYDMLLPKFDKTMTEAGAKIDEELRVAKEKSTDAKTWVYDKLEIKRKMLQQLSLLLSRKNYLEGGSIQD